MASNRQVLLTAKRISIQLQEGQIDKHDLSLLEKGIQQLLLQTQTGAPIDALARLHLIPDKLVRATSLPSLSDLISRVVQDLQALQNATPPSASASPTVRRPHQVFQQQEQYQKVAPVSVAPAVTTTVKRFHLPKSASQETVNNIEIVQPTVPRMSAVAPLPNIEESSGIRAYSHHPSASPKEGNVGSVEAVRPSINNAVQQNQQDLVPQSSHEQHEYAEYSLATEEVSDYLFLLERLRVDLTKGARPSLDYIEYIQEKSSQVCTQVKTQKAELAQKRIDMKKVWEKELQEILRQQQDLQDQWKSVLDLEQTLEDATDLRDSILKVLEFHQSHSKKNASLKSRARLISSIAVEDKEEFVTGRRMMFDQLQLVLEQREQDGTRVNCLVERLDKIKLQNQTDFERELKEKYGKKNCENTLQLVDALEKDLQIIFKQTFFTI